MRRDLLLLVLLCVAQFMLILDVTVINVALPELGADLGLGRSALTWSVTAYTLCFGGLMLFGGRLGDTFGARRVLLAGLAGNATALVGGRIAQGVGAALLSPSALALLTRSFHGPARARALGVWAALGGAGFTFGALLGGLLTAGPGWRWVFFVNVPVGLVVLALLPRFADDVRPDHPRPLDLPGALLVTGATGALIYGLVHAGDAGWTAPSTLLPLGGAIILYAGFGAIERLVTAPLMDVRVLGRRPVATGALLMLTATALMLALVFLASLRLQRVGGLSALETGLLFLPAALGTAVTGHLAGPLLHRFGTRAVAASGFLLAAAGGAVLTQSTATPGVVAGTSLAIAGIIPVFVAATTTALGYVSPHEAGLASGIVNTTHEVGGSLGIALASTIAATGLETGTATGFTSAYTTITATALAASLVAVVLIPRGRAHLPEGAMAH